MKKILFFNMAMSSGDMKHENTERMRDNPSEVMLFFKQ